MIVNKNRVFKCLKSVHLRFYIIVMILLYGGVSCQKKQDQSIMVASSLGRTLEQWVDENHQKILWEGAGSQRIRQWIEAGATPLFAILADPRHVEALQKQKLISWTLKIACTDLALAYRTPHGTQNRVELSMEQWLDIAKKDLIQSRLAIATEEVPLGYYSHILLKKSAQFLGNDWLENTKKSMITQPLSAGATATILEAGEVEWALLYRVMAFRRPKLSLMTFPQPLRIQATYVAVGLSAQGKIVAEDLKKWLLLRPQTGLTSCKDPESAL